MKGFNNLRYQTSIGLICSLMKLISEPVKISLEQLDSLPKASEEAHVCHP